jgi:pimeloyl-ACP methyl ester carboxylesterase
LEFVDKEFNKNYQFKKIDNPLPEKERIHADKYQIYDINYYKDSIHLIENINSPEECTFEIGGEVLVTRKYVSTFSHHENSFTLYSHLRRSGNQKPIASIAIVHGNSENSDNFLEVAIHHALNGFDVHIIDLKGQGMSSGEKIGHYKIQEHHNQIVSMLKEVREDLPCFLQAHSMGCLNTIAFLINNPHLKIDSVFAGSPFWGFGSKISTI